MPPRIVAFGALATPDAAAPLAAAPLALPPDAHAVSLAPGGFAFAAAVVDGRLVVGGTAGPPTAAPPPPRLTAAAAGYDTLIVLDADGTVHGAGWDGAGQASGRCRGGGGGGGGDGDRAAGGGWRRIPVSVPVVAVAVGTQHALALDARGTVWGWGSTAHGAVGGGDRAGGHPPAPVLGPAGATLAPPVAAVAAGGHHSVAVDGGGGVWCWGSNLRGQCGAPPSSPSTPAPTPLPALAGVGVTAVAAGAAHSVALTVAGEAFAWGAGDALGRGSGGGGASSPPADDAAPAAVPVDAHLTSVSCGAHHTVATDSGGGVWVWGVVGGGRPKAEGAGMPPTRVVASGAVAAVAGWWHGVVVMAE